MLKRFTQHPWKEGYGNYCPGSMPYDVHYIFTLHPLKAGYGNITGCSSAGIFWVYTSPVKSRVWKPYFDGKVVRDVPFTQYPWKAGYGNITHPLVICRDFLSIHITREKQGMETGTGAIESSDWTVYTSPVKSRVWKHNKHYNEYLKELRLHITREKQGMET